MADLSDVHPEERRQRAAAQMDRIIFLLEELAIATASIDEVAHKEQCPYCHRFFERLASHTPHCRRAPPEVGGERE